MVSLCVMGWGLVLLENSSVAAVAAVTQGGPLPKIELFHDIRII